MVVVVAGEFGAKVKFGKKELTPEEAAKKLKELNKQRLDAQKAKEGALQATAGGGAGE